MSVIKVSQRELNRILCDAAYLGYSSLSSEEKAVCEAFDKGTLVVKESK